jgi:hypothetical protein
MNSPPIEKIMERAMPSQDEIQLLRALCDENPFPAQRIELLKSLEGHPFLNPEYQVVFESIHFLLSHGGVNRSRLAVHLNNRGFPDVDLEKYFSGPTSTLARKENVIEPKA